MDRTQYWKEYKQGQHQQEKENKQKAEIALKKKRLSSQRSMQKLRLNQAQQKTTNKVLPKHCLERRSPLPNASGVSVIMCMYSSLFEFVVNSDYLIFDFVSLYSSMSHRTSVITLRFPMPLFLLRSRI